jgi:hypothetical protein
MNLPQPKDKTKHHVEIIDGKEYKVCTKCLQKLSIENFGKYSWKNLYYPRCRKCVNEDSKISKSKKYEPI